MNRKLLIDQFNLTSDLAMSNSKSIPQFKGILYEQLDDGFGNPILHKVGENTVTVGGAIESLEHLCNKPASWKPKTLNQLFGLNENVAGTPYASSIALFGVGNEGCGDAWGSIKAKDIKNDNVPGFIPLRYGNAITDDDASKYYFKYPNPDGTFSWYLKEISNIDIKSCWKNTLDDDADGTEITNYIAGMDTTDGIQTFADFLLEFNTSDVREYYEQNGDLDNAKYNSIGLYLGEKVKLPDGSEEYVNVRLFSYLNIDNKSVRLKTESQYVYRILSLV